MDHEKTPPSQMTASSPTPRHPPMEIVTPDQKVDIDVKEHGTDGTLGLSMAASVASFESNTIERFRRNITVALRQELVSGTKDTIHKKDGICRYNYSQLHKALQYKVNWIELCQAHDSHFERRQQQRQRQLQGLPSSQSRQQHSSLTTINSTTTTTALQELIGHCLNPCLIPRACAKLLVEIWMSALVQSPSRRRHCRSSSSEKYNLCHVPKQTQKQQQQVTVLEPIGCRWSFSQLMLLNSIVQILATQPHLETSFQGILLEHIVPTTSGGTKKNNSKKEPHCLSFSPTRWRRILSIIQHLAQDKLLWGIQSLQRSFTVCILVMIQKLDDTDLLWSLQVEEGDSKLETNEKRMICLYCSRKRKILERDGGGASKKRIKGPARSGLSFSEVLHDREEIGDGMKIQQALASKNHHDDWFQQRSSNGGGRSSRVSYLNVLQASSADTPNTADEELILVPSWKCDHCVGSAEPQSRNSKTTTSSPKARESPQYSANKSMSKEWRLVQSRACQKFLSLGSAMIQRGGADSRGGWSSQRQNTCRYELGSIVVAVDNNKKTSCSAFHLSSFLLDMAFQNYMSPSWRACLLLLVASHQEQIDIIRQMQAHMLSANTTTRSITSSSTSSDTDRVGNKNSNDTLFVSIALKCWKHYTKTQNTIWLRLYAEWVVECAHFDDPVACCKVLVPLVQYWMDQHQQQSRGRQYEQKEPIEHESHEIRCEQQKVSFNTKLPNHCSSSSSTIHDPAVIGNEMFACLVYLFSSRRAWIFQSPTPSDDQDCRNSTSNKEEDSLLFPTFMTTLSVSYGDGKYWCHDKMTVSEQDHTISTLQRMGILGIVLPNCDEEKFENWDSIHQEFNCSNDDLNKKEEGNHSKNNGDDQSWDFDEEYHFDDVDKLDDRSQDQGDNDSWELDEEFDDDDFDRMAGDSHHTPDDSQDFGDVTKKRQQETEEDVDVGMIEEKHNDGDSCALSTSEFSSPSSQSEKMLDAIGTWPFSAQYDIRSAFERLKRNNASAAEDAIGNVMRTDCDAFGIKALSTIFSDEDNPYLISRADTVANPAKHNDCDGDGDGNGRIVPMLDYLHNDLLRIIFSFFGYKRLVKIREVCNNWKMLSDTSNWLWYGVYRSRFGILAQDPLAGSSFYEETCTQGTSKTLTKNRTKENNWKDLFRTKWSAEQSLRFCRHQETGWRHRTCGYIGCFKIMMSSKKQESHYQLHIQMEQKQQKRDERIRQRDEKKRQKEKVKALKTVNQSKTGKKRATRKKIAKKVEKG